MEEEQLLDVIEVLGRSVGAQQDNCIVVNVRIAPSHNWIETPGYVGAVQSKVAG